MLVWNISVHDMVFLLWKFTIKDHKYSSLIAQLFQNLPKSPDIIFNQATARDESNGFCVLG